MMDTLGASDHQLCISQRSQYEYSLVDDPISDDIHNDLEPVEAPLNVSHKSFKDCLGLHTELGKLIYSAANFPDALDQLFDGMTLMRSALMDHLPENTGMIEHKQKDKWNQSRPTKPRAPFAMRKRRKIAKRVGEAYETRVRAADISTKHVNEKNQLVIEEPVLDQGHINGQDVFMDDADGCIIEVSSDDDDDQESHHVLTRSDVTNGDLHDLSENRMLNDTVMKVIQNMIRMAYPGVVGLEETIFGEFKRFSVHKDTPFVQILYNGAKHWVAISSYGCEQDEVLESLKNSFILSLY